MANLQDTTELVSELTSKLADLDSKVAAYRLDMAAEFTRHSEELLRNVPDNVAYQVSQVISDSLKNFPSLYPQDSLNSSPSHTPISLEDTNQRLRGSPPPVLPHTSANLKDAAKPLQQQRGPHERELEFQGLFTPTYLPLLEKVDRPLHSPPSSPATAEAATTDRHLSVTSAQGSDSSHRRGRPSPLRRATNTSIDSVVSDTSSTRTRKSALRRSSGSSRPPDSPRDPRRVRFDFQGQEVLPSSSPQTAPNALTENNDVREQSTRAQSSYTTSLGDVEGEEDQHQPPKKVSSTQALRALSKAPLDEGTIWTIVNTESALEASSSSDEQQLRKNTDNNSSSRTAAELDNMTLQNSPDPPQEEVNRHTGVKDDDLAGSQQPERTEEEHEMDDSEDSEEEATLFMVSKKALSKKMSLPVSSKAASRKSAAQTQAETTADVAPIPIRAAIPDQITATGTDGEVKMSSTADQSGQAPKKPSSKPTAYDEDEDDFFEFDDDEDQGGIARKSVTKEPKKYLPETRDDEPEEEINPSAVPTEQAKDSEDVLPRSPPINIDAKVRAITPEHKIPKKIPRKPEGNRQPSTSIGSFGGRPVIPSAVKDKALLEKLEKADVDVPFFVGSVNGRSGPDASNIKSYQASLMSPTTASGGFASGSFAERMMWEKSQGITYESDGETQNDKGKGGKNVGG